MGLLEERDLMTLERPTIHTADLNCGLPFPSSHFDFIYSQVSFFLFREKLLFLEECSRVLAPGSVAWIDVNPLKLGDVPPELAILLDIRTDEGPVDFWTFVEEVSWLSRREASMRDYLEIRKHDPPNLNAVLKAAVDLTLLHNNWHGTKSIYSTPSGRPDM